MLRGPARFAALATTVAALAAASCQYDPYTAIFTTRPPKTADVAGDYVLDEASVRLVAEGGYASRATAIHLDADGSMTFTALPDWWHTDFGDPGGRFDTGRGTWEVEPKQEKWWKVTARIRETTPDSPFQVERGGHFAEWVLADETPPYRLVLTLGDPDEGRAMVFERSDAHGR